MNGRCRALNPKKEVQKWKNRLIWILIFQVRIKQIGQLKFKRRKRQPKNHPNAREMGNKWLEIILKERSVGNILMRSKKMAREWLVSVSTVVLYIRRIRIRMGRKTLKIIFQGALKPRKSKQTKTNSIDF